MGRATCIDCDKKGIRRRQSGEVSKIRCRYCGFISESVYGLASDCDVFIDMPMVRHSDGSLTMTVAVYSQVTLDTGEVVNLEAHQEVRAFMEVQS